MMNFKYFFLLLVSALTLNIKAMEQDDGAPDQKRHQGEEKKLALCTPFSLKKLCQRFLRLHTTSDSYDPTFINSLLNGTMAPGLVNEILPALPASVWYDNQETCVQSLLQNHLSDEVKMAMMNFLPDYVWYGYQEVFAQGLLKNNLPDELKKVMVSKLPADAMSQIAQLVMNRSAYRIAQTAMNTDIKPSVATAILQKTLPFLSVQQGNWQWHLLALFNRYMADETVPASEKVSLLDTLLSDQFCQHLCTPEMIQYCAQRATLTRGLVVKFLTTQVVVDEENYVPTLLKCLEGKLLNKQMYAHGNDLLFTQVLRDLGTLPRHTCVDCSGIMRTISPDEVDQAQQAFLQAKNGVVIGSLDGIALFDRDSKKILATLTDASVDQELLGADQINNMRACLSSSGRFVVLNDKGVLRVFYEKITTSDPLHIVYKNKRSISLYVSNIQVNNGRRCIEMGMNADKIFFKFEKEGQHIIKIIDLCDALLCPANLEELVQSNLVELSQENIIALCDIVKPLLCKYRPDSGAKELEIVRDRILAWRSSGQALLTWNPVAYLLNNVQIAETVALIANISVLVSYEGTPRAYFLQLLRAVDYKQLEECRTIANMFLHYCREYQTTLSVDDPKMKVCQKIEQIIDAVKVMCTLSIFHGPRIEDFD